MTLEEFIKQEQELAENVQVDPGDGTIRDEYHPIPAEALPIMRQIWTMQYDQWQRVDAWRSKENAKLLRREMAQVRCASR